MNERNRALLRAAGVELPEAQDNQTPEPAEATPTPDLRTCRETAARLYGLPDALVDRLNGESEAAVLADAARLSEELSAPKSPPAEAVALARQAARQAAQVRSWGIGVVGGKLSPPPEDVGQPIPRKTESPVPYDGD